LVVSGREHAEDFNPTEIRDYGGDCERFDDTNTRGNAGVVGSLSLTVLIKIQLFSLRPKTEFGAIRCGYDL
jgi:hypothetical protein